MKGYFKGNCMTIHFKVQGKEYDYDVYDEDGLNIVDDVLGEKVKITDKATIFAFWFNKIMFNTFDEVDEEVVKKAIEIFKSDNLSFVEVN